jgi:tRNA (cmo5U34)-methyltransferase
MNNAVVLKDSLGHMPTERWAFDQSVTDVFPDMLRRSIPQYEVMRQAVFDIGCAFVKPHTAIVDLGCARGAALAPFITKFGTFNQHLGIDVSQPMLAAARDQFAGEIAGGRVSFASLDLRSSYPQLMASLTLCVLTLQFTPVEHRQRILRDAWRHTVPGGAVVLVEKVLGDSADIGALMIHLYHEQKARNGYTAEEIECKRLSLEGVLVPVTARWNEDLLKTAGFNQIDCFWRWMNFSAWVAVKT